MAVVESIAGRGRGGGIENIREERRRAPPGDTLRAAIMVAVVVLVLVLPSLCFQLYQTLFANFHVSSHQSLSCSKDFAIQSRRGDSQLAWLMMENVTNGHIECYQ